MNKNFRLGIVSLIVLLFTIPSIFAVSGVDKQTSVAFTFTSNIQKLVTDYCTDKQTNGDVDYRRPFLLFQT